jgi:23S rRNA pseudouridine1911/1915/1917 synthase
MENPCVVNEQIRNFKYEGATGLRLDKFLTAQLPDYSRSQLQNLIKAGNVNVNGQPVTKTGFLVEHQHQVEIHLPEPEPTDLVPEDIPLDIVFENKSLMVVNKPAGMVVHPAAGHSTGTLVHAALAHAPEMEGIHGEQRPGVVHRLDKDTSGLIVVAKDDKAHRWLQNQFRARKVRKVYLALVDGHPPTPTGRIEAHIGRDSAMRRRMAVVSPSKGRGIDDRVSDTGTIRSVHVPGSASIDGTHPPDPHSSCIYWLPDRRRQPLRAAHANSQIKPAFFACRAPDRSASG